jgi:hypothetical protein
MMRAAVILLSAPLAACVAADSGTAPVAARADAAPLRVLRADGSAFAFFEGAAARRQADAQCGAKGVQASIYDRYDAGAWVFVEGCA